MNNKIIFLPGLNGIRTIAALGVLFSHINLALNDFGIEHISLFGFTNEGKAKSWVLGEHGVTIFFVLSGFLITYLLLKEFEKTNTIDIKKFYIRRILRIWPLYFLYISLVLVLLFNQIVIDNNLGYYLTFFANIPFVLGNSYAGMSHLWSIGVEEQFYLFWPLLFLFFVKKDVLFSLTSLIIVALSLFRVLIWYFSPFSTVALFSVVNRFDCMLLGGLGAYLFFNNSKIIGFLNLKAMQYISWTIMLLLFFDKFHFLNSIIEIFIVELITLIIIIGQVKVNHRVVNLENKPFSYIGKLSFGLYVYHPLVIIILSKYVNFKIFENDYLNSLTVCIVVFGASVFIAHLSYNLFEKKFLNKKNKFSVVKSSNIKEEQ